MRAKYTDSGVPVRPNTVLFYIYKLAVERVKPMSECTSWEPALQCFKCHWVISVDNPWPSCVSDIQVTQDMLSINNPYTFCYNSQAFIRQHLHLKLVTFHNLGGVKAHYFTKSVTWLNKLSYDTWHEMCLHLGSFSSKTTHKILMWHAENDKRDSTFIPQKRTLLMQAMSKVWLKYIKVHGEFMRGSSKWCAFISSCYT